jgi:hypothetical protein
VAPKSKNVKAPRVILADLRTGLPIPLGKEGIPHLSGGPWAHFTSTAPGNTLDAKVDWLTKHRYLQLYQDVLSEIDNIKRHGGRLHPLQRRISTQQGDAESLYKIVFRNPTKVPGGVRWVGEEPNPADMAVWELVQTIQRSSPNPERNLVLRQALHEAVMTASLWPRGSTQSTGVRPVAFLEANPISVGNLVAHLRKCGVTTTFCGEHIRLFILRGSSQSYTRVQAAQGSPVEPGQIVSTAAASLLAQQTMREPSSSSVEAGPGDEDVPRASTELGSHSLSETTEKAPDNQE